MVVEDLNDGDSRIGGSFRGALKSGGSTGEDMEASVQMTIFGQNESPGLCCYGKNPLYLLITMQTGCTMSELWPPITQDVLIHSHINISLDMPQNVGICMGVNGKIFGGHSRHHLSANQNSVLHVSAMVLVQDIVRETGISFRQLLRI